MQAAWTKPTQPQRLVHVHWNADLSHIYFLQAGWTCMHQAPVVCARLASQIYLAKLRANLHHCVCKHICNNMPALTMPTDYMLSSVQGNRLHRGRCSASVCRVFGMAGSPRPPPGQGRPPPRPRPERPAPRRGPGRPAPRPGLGRPPPRPRPRRPPRRRRHRPRLAHRPPPHLCAPTSSFSSLTGRSCARRAEQVRKACLKVSNPNGRLVTAAGQSGCQGNHDS